MSHGDGIGTHLSYNTGVRISGRIIAVDAVVGGTTKELYISAEVFDQAANGRAVEHTGSGICNLYFEKARAKSAVYGTSFRLQRAVRTRFDGLITAAGYSRMESCNIAAGMTVTSDLNDSEFSPSGMVHCNFAGTFTGPANSCRMDGNTNYWFVTNGVALGGAATKTIQESLL